MSTLEKAIELLQEMPERKLEAVYMYMRYVSSQSDDNDTSANETAKTHIIENSVEKKQKAFQSLY